MSDGPYTTLLEARQAVGQLQLSARNRKFLEQAFEVMDDKPILQIEVFPIEAKGGARVIVYFQDGDRREFAAG